MDYMVDATGVFEELDGVLCRQWRGITEAGCTCTVYTPVGCNDVRRFPTQPGDLEDVVLTPTGRWVQLGNVACEVYHAELGEGRSEHVLVHTCVIRQPLPTYDEPRHPERRHAWWN